MIGRGAVPLAPLVGLLAVACVAAGVAAAQTPAGPRDVFERFLTAGDAEAELLCEVLAAESPAVLAEWASPRFDGASGARVVRVPGVDPPLAATLITPRRAPPPGGYPLAVVALAGPYGPEETELRGRYGELLEAGAAILAPVFSAAWLQRAPPVSEPRGAQIGRLVALMVAAQRAAPVDPSRRVLIAGEPASSFHPGELRDLAPAFPVLQLVLSGEGWVPEDFDDVPPGPRRLSIHHGARLGDAAAARLRHVAALGAESGVETRFTVDPRLEHASTARFTAPGLTAGLAELRPNAPPRRAAVAFETGRSGRGVAGSLVGAVGAAGRVSLEGLGDETPVLTADAPLPPDGVTLQLPRTAAAFEPWTAPARWRPAPPALRPTFVGLKAAVAPPDRARQRLWAFRLEQRGGVPVAGVMRLHLTNP